jgi:hypothetical protein
MRASLPPGSDSPGTVERVTILRHGTTGRRLRRVLMLALGAAAVVPLLAVDPAVVALLLDADFLVLAGVVGLALLRGDARLVLGRAAASLPVLWVRSGVSLTRSRPGTLLGR